MPCSRRCATCPAGRCPGSTSRRSRRTTRRSRCGCCTSSATAASTTWTTAPRASPELLRVRRDLEERLWRRSCGTAWPGVPDGVDLAHGFFDWVADHDGPSLARHVQTEATEEQVLDLLRVRSVYHLKEADPTTWVIPRLPVAAKAALVELQYDEYGVGDPRPAARPPVGARHGGQRAAARVRRLRGRGAGWRSWSRTTRCRCSGCSAGCAERRSATSRRSRRPARCRRAGWRRGSSGSASRPR